MAEATALPSAAVVYTGANGGNGAGQGAAAIYGPSTQYNNALARINQEMYAERAQKIRDRQQAQKDWMALQATMPDTWNVDSVELAGDVKGYNNSLVEMRRSGMNPLDYYGEGGKKAQEQERGIKVKGATAKQNQQFFQDAKKAIDSDTEGKYDKAHATKWFNEYLDPNKTIAQRAEMRLNGSPLKADISRLDVLTKYAPKYQTDTVESGAKTKKREYVDWENYKMGLAEGMKDDVFVQEAFKAGVTDGKWEDFDGFADSMVQLAKGKFPDSESVTYDEARATPRATAADTKAEEKRLAYDYGNALSTGKWGSGWDVTYQKNDEGTVTVNARKNQADWSPMKVIDMQGDTIDKFRHQKFFTKDGKLYSHGTMEDETGDQIEVSVPFDNNAGEFITVMDGFDPREMIAKAGSETSVSVKITPEDFDSKWAALKPGESLTGPDGKKYTKK